MDIAVIVPVYNRGATVLEALAGVAAQTSLPKRLIVVDDGSTDDTATAVGDWIRARQPPFPTELIRQQNGGVSAARNRGILQITDCRYVAFLDSDDVWPVDFLERAGRAFAANRRAVAATCDRLYENSDTGATRLERLDAIQQDATRWLMANDGGIASASLFLTDAVNARCRFDETLETGEDLALFLEISLDGPWLHLPGRPVTFRHGHCGKRDEAQNLSGHFVDNHSRWARVYEDFVTRHCNDGLPPGSFCSRVLANRWYRAGRELMRAGRVSEARRCFQRSTRWKLANKAWLRLAASFLRPAA